MIWFLLIAFAILVAVKLFSGESKKTSTSVVDNYTQAQGNALTQSSGHHPVTDNRIAEVYIKGQSEPVKISISKEKPEPEVHLTSAQKKAAAHARRVEKLKNKAKEIFSDQESSVKDFSNLTPEQAERKLERLKNEDGWVEDSVYKGLIRIINKDYPVMEIPEDVLKGTPQDMERWFLGSHDSFGFSNEVFKTIASVLKPYHEANLLKELEDVPFEKLEEWMNEKKRKGIFFSNKVYSKMRKKWLSQYNL